MLKYVYKWPPLLFEYVTCVCPELQPELQAAGPATRASQPASQASQPGQSAT